MGWALSQNTTQQRQFLKPGKIVIGRAQTAQIRPAHQSVSRLHAEIHVDAVLGPVSDVAKPAIRILDTSSTGHTFVNGKPSGKGQPLALSEGDSLTFGVDPVTYTVVWAPTYVSFSSKDGPQEAQRLEELARTAGVFLTTEWHATCTHLIMETLAVTPKLLCCVAAGAVPVRSSFLAALAGCEFGAPRPDPLTHKPQAPLGADAAFALDLDACCTSPRARRGLLQGVWVIVGAKQSFDVLAMALQAAGARVHVGSSPNDAALVVEDMRHVAAQRIPGSLREFWAVPGFIDSTTAEAFAEPVRSLGFEHALAVPLQTLLACILSARLEVVHDSASQLMPLPGNGAAAAQASTPPPATPAFVDREPQPVKMQNVKEEQNTQQQQRPAARAAASREAISASAAPSSAGPTAAAPASAAASAVAGSALQAAAPAPLSAPSAGVANGLRSDQVAAAASGGGLPGEPAVKRQRLSEAAAPQAPTAAAAAVAAAAEALASGGGQVSTASGTQVGGRRTKPWVLRGEEPKVKQEPKELDGGAADASSKQAPWAATASQPALRLGGTVASSYRGSLYIDTQMQSQPKQEVKLEQKKEELPAEAAMGAAASKKEEPPAAKTKAEAARVSNAAAPAANAGGATATAAPARVHEQPVVHPAGQWLGAMKKEVKAEGREYVTPEGLAIPRALWAPDPDAVRLVPRAATSARAAPAPVAAASSARGTGRNFKVFRKSAGQRPFDPDKVVEVIKWVPPVKPLGELFNSQAVDSQTGSLGGGLPPVVFS
eukprot:TRINITY_DN15228_c0_g2_i1.p1 TRINITY_DN15228_c0_g2~~TRINITY_DN15228_c0_g2_i1.p1  ORF type:complete len:773 (-),score=167.58 TRINITY_DN15228_c0_g2_i1:191-2509(-)